jgi:MFS family permease
VGQRSSPGAGRPPLPRSLGWALGTGTILQGFNSSIIAVALVSIGVHFGDSAALPWLVSGLYIACAVASPAAGRFVDLFGARRLYLAGLAIVLAASLAGPFVPSVEWLVVDRIVLGIGASVHFPAAMAIIRQQAHALERDGRSSIGTIALCGQSMAAIGPSIGGVIVLFVGWQGIFWVNVPLVIGSAAWVLAAVPRDRIRTRSGPVTGFLALLDPVGLTLFVAALVCTMGGLLALDGLLTGDAHGLVLLAASVPLWALFVLREKRAATPFLDIGLLIRHPELAATCGRAILTFLAFYCVFYGMPQWFEIGRGLTPAGAGLLMFPVFGVGVLSTIVATAVGRTLPPRSLLLIGGLGFLVAGVLVAVLLTPESPYWVMIVIGALLGIPNGFNNIGNQLILLQSVPSDSAGVASGLYRTAQYVGAALSSVVVAFVLAGGGLDGGGLDGGIAPLGQTIGVLGLILALLSVVALVRGRRR